MGVQNLWTTLGPYYIQKPLCVLRGKKVAIDLAGWVCESLNVVDYAIHPRQHLKNLFFRTCYLLWIEVTPVFVLEGEAPKLKSAVIAKRNELQFRGVRPREKGNRDKPLPTDKGRSRFNQVLRQCESLLQSMGIQCLQAPGEAEAYCAFINKHGLVDGVISQDSDCFAYGAVRVYRNFSISMQGTHAAQGGAVDVYDMIEICEKMVPDFGRNKVIAMALLCGCDYCPDGIEGIGRDSVMKLFARYKNNIILDRLRQWRQEDAKYTALEMRVDDKTVCSYCGHLGRTQSHTKSGCGVCRTHRGCDESLWKEERLALKAELQIRKKALTNPDFPSQEIIDEFLNEPEQVPNINYDWKQPNLVKFIQKIGHLLQWPEIYCFQKFFPLVTRWQLSHHTLLTGRPGRTTLVEPQEIVKKRVVKGMPSLEIIWQDAKGLFPGLIPQQQLDEYNQENAHGPLELWTTVEPTALVEGAYPELVAAFIKSKEKPKKTKNPTKARRKAKAAGDDMPLGSLDNLNDLVEATAAIGKTLKPKRLRKKQQPIKAVQTLDQFLQTKDISLAEGEELFNKYLQTGVLSAEEMQLFRKFLQRQRQQQLIQSLDSPLRNFTKAQPKQCSTPLYLPPPDQEEDSDSGMSAIIDAYVSRPRNYATILSQLIGYPLQTEPMTQNLSLLLGDKEPLPGSKDDLDLAMAQKRNLSTISQAGNAAKTARFSLDDSFDVLIAKEALARQSLQKADVAAATAVGVAAPSSPMTLEDSFDQLVNLKSSRHKELFGKSPAISTHVNRFKERHGLAVPHDGDAPMAEAGQERLDGDVSFFFDCSGDRPDAFEQMMEQSFARSPSPTEARQLQVMDFVEISSSSDE